MEALSADEEREVAGYEDLRSCANRMMWTIDLQIRRLRAEMLDVDDFPLKLVSDAEFLVVALDRLLSVCRRIDKMTGGKLQGPIAEYDRALPQLRTARNVIAHIDEYLLGEGNDKSVPVGALSVHSFDVDRLEIAGFEFNLAEAARVADNLFSAVRCRPPASYQRAVSLASSTS